MVFSQVQQPPDSYQLFHRFGFPTPDGHTIDAVAVPARVNSELNSAYTIMIASTVVNVWAIVIAVGIYFYLGKNKPDAHPADHDKRVTGVSMSVWNKRASPPESLLDTLLYAREEVGEWWFWPLVLAIVVFWTAQLAAGILIPKEIFVGNAAPVAATSIYVPSQKFAEDDRLHQSAVYALDVPAALRAAGAALVANASVQAQVTISQPITLGMHSATEPIQRIEYSYKVDGTDMGLQHYPDLLLTVTGACTTDYTWRAASGTIAGTNYTADFYYPFANASQPVTKVSLYDGSAPTCNFFTGDISPTGPPSNITWGAVVSSVDRGSFSIGTDPWYLTTPSPTYNSTDPAALPNVVKGKRPALSCWQNDEWSFRGAKSDIAHLGPPELPGLGLSDGMQNILTRYLGTPKVVNVALRLNPSSLQSATTALGLGFDAGASSMENDLRRLVLAAYIATVNTLTDTTLYSQEQRQPGTAIPNIALDSNQVPLPGVGDFVVYSADVVTLSVKTLIIIPTVALASWILMMLLLHMTPLKQVGSMEVMALFQDLRRVHEYANIVIDKATKKSKWVFGIEDHHAKPPTADEEQGLPSPPLEKKTMEAPTEEKKD
ncbi:hypothetical protein QBC46DRAFT_296074 [Diplogelasinospora grovesii]|uniref:Uncharacterized protein n=1 Tax=Diplogelasinospora grovesii TaxID=303347 RepID=A0AAN6S0C6_9PEZI|nr:hypothetical protein QBC46DRAFT_296074 [Diplogelasinospora grovesii]